MEWLWRMDLLGFGWSGFRIVYTALLLWCLLVSVFCYITKRDEFVLVLRWIALIWVVTVLEFPG